MLAKLANEGVWCQGCSLDSHYERNSARKTERALLRKNSPSLAQIWACEVNLRIQYLMTND